MNRMQLHKGGISISVGLQRFNGNASVYERLLMAFPDDPNFGKLAEALEAGDVQNAFHYAHALKGVAGNLAIIDLESKLYPLVELLRGNKLEGSAALFQDVAKSYAAAVEAITGSQVSVVRLHPGKEAAAPDSVEIDFAQVCLRTELPMVVIDPGSRLVIYANSQGLGLLGFDEKSLGTVPCWRMLKHRASACPDCPIVDGLRVDEPVTRHQYVESLQANVSIIYRAFLSNDAPLVLCSVQPDDAARTTMDEVKKQNELASARSDMLSRVTHDMRTPMNTILGLSYLIADKQDLGEVKSDVRQIAAAGKYLLELINDTLDAEKLNSGLARLHICVCDQKDIVDNAYGIVSQSMAEKHIDFSLQNDAPWKHVLTDGQRLEQVMVNLLGNAVKFTPSGGSITVRHQRLRDEGSLVLDRISVSDTGCGMSPQFAQQMFEPFTQEEDSLRSENKGTGLGLFLVKQTMELMGGTIDVDSAKGKGTTISLTLEQPVAVVEAGSDQGKPEPSAADYDFRGCRILLFEDHALNAAITSQLLEKVGCTVVHAENGRIGVDIFEKAQPGDFDVVLMDIRMPVMDGIQATRAIRALNHPDAKKVPIVALSANAFNSDIEESAKAGMNGHLAKPIEPQQLYRTLAEVLPKYVRRSAALPKVLFVDDEPTNIAMLDTSLRSYYDILTASSGEEALDVLAANPDIVSIITDLQMPGMGGREFIRMVRSERKYDAIAVLANTQYGGPEQEEDLLRIGANDFIYKPTTSHIVQIRLLNTLRRRG